MKIASVINFCTHDLRFLDKCVQAVVPISEQILVPVCDHFFDGTPEDLGVLRSLYARYPQVTFIEFPYSTTELFGTPAQLVPSSPDWATHWHNTARYLSFFFLKPAIDWVFFFDVDEILETERWKSWLDQTPLEKISAFRFATYWYFRSARYRALEQPDGPLLVRRSLLTPQLLLDPDERCGLFSQLQGGKKRLVLGADGLPLVHHYSWVRTEEELLKKVSRWGHHWERPWPSLIHTAYSVPFQGEDFVRNYRYEEVDPYWDPLAEQLPPLSDEHGYAHRVTPRELFQLEIAWLAAQP